MKEEPTWLGWGRRQASPDDETEAQFVLRKS